MYFLGQAGYPVYSESHRLQNKRFLNVFVRLTYSAVLNCFRAEYFTWCFKNANLLL